MNAIAEDLERHVVSQMQIALQGNLDTIAAAYLPFDQQEGHADPDGTSWVKLKAPERTRGAPNGWGDYYPGGIDTASAWPSIEVAVPDTELSNFDIGQTDADAHTNLIVQIWLKDGRFPVLNKMGKRYAAAVLATLQDPTVLPFAIESVRKAWRTNPSIQDENDRITTGVLMFFSLSGSLVY